MVNKRIHEIMGLCYHESSGMTWICGKCKTDIGYRPNGKSVTVESLNYNFLSLSDSQILLDWCRENIGRECQHKDSLGRDYKNRSGKCKDCHGSGKISNLPKIIEIVKLLWEGEECPSPASDRPGARRIHNRPLAWAIWGEVVRPYCYRQKWIDSFISTFLDKAKSADDIGKIFHPLAFVTALEEFLKGEK